MAANSGGGEQETESGESEYEYVTLTSAEVLEKLEEVSGLGLRDLLPVMLSRYILYTTHE